MTTITGRDYRAVLTPPHVADAYKYCNFSKPSPGTRIFPDDDTPREFRNCNLTNCVVPPGSTVLVFTNRRNFTDQVPPSVIDTRYEDCNFSQHVPAEDAGKKVGVKIFGADTTPRTFFDCNLCNCEPPPGSTFNRGATIKEFGVVHETEEIWVDGVLIDTLVTTKSVIHGRYTTAEEYEYFPIAKEVINR